MEAYDFFMRYLNIAVGIFTFSIFLAIIGLDSLARYGAITSGILALTYVVLALWERYF